MSLTLQERIEKYSKPLENGCIVWTSAKNIYGYGVIHFKGKTRFVCRLLWELERGPIPNGMQVCHTCDNPSCRNINHLFLGTARDNALDKMAKGRHNCQFGQVHHKAKLTNEDVLFIRSSPLSHVELAKQYGIRPQSIYSIRIRKNWRHL